MTPLLKLRIPFSPVDPSSAADRVRVNHEQAIEELQQAGVKVIPGVTLVDGKATVIAHGLGRAPIWVAPSAPRTSTTAPISGVGCIVEIRDGTQDRSKVVVLKSSGYGVTVYADIGVL